MHEEEGLTPAEQELELALGRLKPAANTLNRDALMYNAGLAAARGKRPWQMFSLAANGKPSCCPQRATAAIPCFVWMSPIRIIRTFCGSSPTPIYFAAAHHHQLLTGPHQRRDV